MPHKINNEFLWKVHKAIVNKQVNCEYFDIRYSDFATVEFNPNKLDKLYKNYEIFEKNLDEIVKIVPLPKEIGQFDIGFYPGFAVYNPSNPNDLKI